MPTTAMLPRALPIAAARHSSPLGQPGRSPSTLIDYKYIYSSKEIGPKVDELNADILGFRSQGWDNFVFVIYEPERFTTAEQWEEQYRGRRDIRVFVVRGSRPTVAPASIPSKPLPQVPPTA